MSQRLQFLARVLTEVDVKVLTSRSVLLNEPYNDLALDVRHRLCVLVEAQSSFSGTCHSGTGIPVRCVAPVDLADRAECVRTSAD